MQDASVSVPDEFRAYHCLAENLKAASLYACIFNNMCPCLMHAHTNACSFLLHVWVDRMLLE